MKPRELVEGLAVDRFPTAARQIGVKPAPTSCAFATDSRRVSTSNTRQSPAHNKSPTGQIIPRGHQVASADLTIHPAGAWHWRSWGRVAVFGRGTSIQPASKSTADRGRRPCLKPPETGRFCERNEKAPSRGRRDGAWAVSPGVVDRRAPDDRIAGGMGTIGLTAADRRVRIWGRDCGLGMASGVPAPGYGLSAGGVARRKSLRRKSLRHAGPPSSSAWAGARRVALTPPGPAGRCPIATGPAGRRRPAQTNEGPSRCRATLPARL